MPVSSRNRRRVGVDSLFIKSAKAVVQFFPIWRHYCWFEDEFEQRCVKTFLNHEYLADALDVGSDSLSLEQI